jgi:hypothetical protein
MSRICQTIFVRSEQGHGFQVTVTEEAPNAFVVEMNPSFIPAQKRYFDASTAIEAAFKGLNGFLAASGDKLKTLHSTTEEFVPAVKVEKLI